jgi:hypothetical protein
MKVMNEIRKKKAQYFVFLTKIQYNRCKWELGLSGNLPLSKSFHDHMNTEESECKITPIKRTLFNAKRGRAQNKD